MHLQRLSLILSACLLITTVPASADDCATIQGGTLVNSAAETLETGYDQWGYNYQALKFNGGYCDAYRNDAWCQAYVDVNLLMKWNEAWLSNESCDGDDKLDRHAGYSSYRGSGAWLTNHQSGEYPDPDGGNKTCKWTYFVKIVAAPTDATNEQGVWMDGSGDKIGTVIWGEFAVVQEVSNDPCAGQNGLAYKGARPALGNWEDDPGQ